MSIPHSRDPRTAPHELRLIFENNKDNLYILNNLAFNPNTPIDILEEIAINSSGYVRSSLLFNPSITEEIHIIIRAQGLLITLKEH